MPDLTGRWAVVTGASSGIGQAMARQLAAWKCNLVVTARRKDRLDELAETLRREHGTGIEVVCADLGCATGPADLYRGVIALGHPIDILVNNAGTAHWRAFADSTWADQAAQLQVNVTSLVELCHRFLPDLLTRPHRCHILNVASIAAFTATPYFANYGATKAYVLSFSEALAAELKSSNVRVTCVCPGGVFTEFSDHAGQTLGATARSTMMSAERCARIALSAMLRGRRVITPGGMSKLTRVFSEVLPHRLTGAVGARIIGDPGPAKLSSPSDDESAP